MRAGKDAQRLELLVKDFLASLESLGPHIRRHMIEKIDHLLSENDAFVKLMEILLNTIEEALSVISAKHGKPHASSPDPALLRELREACVKYDIGKVDKVMEKLESFKYENGEALITWLHEQVDDMSFSEITGGNWPDIDAKSA